jgi:hypothetical protein
MTAMPVTAVPVRVGARVGVGDRNMAMPVTAMWRCR